MRVKGRKSEGFSFLRKLSRASLWFTGERKERFHGIAIL
jgi:hypothetical protein